MKKTWHYYLAAAIPCAFLVVAFPVARAQDPNGGYVSRKEYEELKAELLELKRELASLKKEKSAVSKQERTDEEAAAEMHKEIVTSAEQAEERAPKSAVGTTNFHLAGFGVGMF